MDKKCEYCLQNNIEQVETLEHVIIECNKYNQEREIYIKIVIERIGSDKWREIGEEGDRGMKHIL